GGVGFQLLHIAGAVMLLDYRGKIVVLEWHNPQCPFVKKHYGTGNMQKLKAYAAKKGVEWFTINSSAPGREGYMDAKKAREMNIGHSIKNPYILDPRGDIGKLYDAKVTPHMFVINTNGTVAYMGAIDDHASPNPDSVEGAYNY